ncbi:MAG: hypothetical protein GF308_11130 [Candidatus Heimdallarchaeota archaeon]|nr:hypothetical protein [Candidatus Heimdallarchaeota archaeon]
MTPLDDSETSEVEGQKINLAQENSNKNTSSEPLSNEKPMEQTAPPPASSEKTPFRTKMRREFRYLRLFLKEFLKWDTFQFIFSHHPICEPFEDHVYKIGRLRICRGCILSYPPLYATVLIFILWPASRAFFVTTSFYLENLWWFVISFGITAIVSRLLGRFHILIKDFSKFTRGAWAGFLFLVILTQHLAFKIGAGLMIFGGMMYLSANRAKDMQQTCHECPWQAQYEECPGWGTMPERFDRVARIRYAPLDPEDHQVERSRQPEEEKQQDEVTESPSRVENGSTD